MIISNFQMLPFPSSQNPLVSSPNHETLHHLDSFGSHSTSLLHNLSIVKEKLHQIRSVVNIVICNHQNSPESLPALSSPVATVAINSMVQELIMTASSMLFTCQQMNNLVVNSSVRNDIIVDDLHRQGLADNNRSTALFDMASNHPDHNEWYNNMTTTYNNNNDCYNNSRIEETTTTTTTTIQNHRISADIVELEASDLLAKYTHYCRICGKGLKRDANLRMHMRAHGDEYKASGALSNPERSQGRDLKVTKMGTKYSCPQQGCRWNQKHAKFQPLKSLICVKNHYKRTHCPKMYVCKLCSRKKFSVLSDLRTHEKHCGDVKWLCSCGTTFSRKDKLMGHVALFVGHAPAIGSSANFRGKF
ncbi:protein SENSITIVE TO PROTON RHIZOTOXICITY 2 [Momordica charantia]|uniref:Protein SENSITIVE TO PROTON RHIZOTOXICITY 2 n=1 Tax=Momordica charantia TaxID=3673 RepID=A0A6J1DFC1_MOMCH|nr:protein SENSITIVE TO PROTON RHIZOTOXICITY 2 [Momordica charantia]